MLKECYALSVAISGGGVVVVIVWIIFRSKFDGVHRFSFGTKMPLNKVYCLLIYVPWIGVRDPCSLLIFGAILPSNALSTVSVQERERERKIC